MPTYQYKCECGNKFELFCRMTEHKNTADCQCGKTAKQIINAPRLIIVKDIYYDSPIDGRPITSEAARREDLARNNCIEYDPCMRQDIDKRARENEIKLDNEIDETIDREISMMSARQREHLDSELTKGLTAEVVRI